MTINEVLEHLQSFNPMSIFVYGSQATQTTNVKSDYEIGVIFNEENYVCRNILVKDILDKGFSIFPFKKAELLQYNIDTPFQKNIYIKTLVEGGAKTVYGEKIIENLPSPTITIQDILMDTSFNLGYALSAVQVFKSGNLELAKEIFYKSCLFSARNLLLLNNNLVLGYNNICNTVLELKLPEEYEYLIKTAGKLRNDINTNIDSSLFYKNISFINKYVIEKILNK